MESALVEIDARRTGPTAPAPFVREAGAGPGVVCVHANASSSGQWRPLMELLAPRFRVFAADSSPIRASIVHVGAWGSTLFTEPTPLAAFAALRIPVLLMVGASSPPAGRGVARLLRRVLPRVEMVELPGLGHMGPVTHPDVVNDAIASFLERS